MEVRTTAYSDERREEWITETRNWIAERQEWSAADAELRIVYDEDAEAAAAAACPDEIIRAIMHDEAVLAGIGAGAAAG